MASSISKTQDLKKLRQILHQSIDELLLELENDARKPPSLDELNTDILLASPVAESPRQCIVRACEKLTAFVQGPMGVSPVSPDRSPTTRLDDVMEVLLNSPELQDYTVDDAVSWRTRVPCRSQHYTRTPIASTSLRRCPKSKYLE